MKNLIREDKIVFFDGICILCNHAVDFLLKTDRLKRLKFASLQSLASSHHLKHAINLFSGSDTIIFYDEGRYYIKSTAVLKIAGYLRFPYNLE